MINTLSVPTNAFLFRQPNFGARVRVFFFSYAGSGASVGEIYRTFLPSSIDFIPIQLPGRENRIAEDPYTNMEMLIQSVLQALAPYFDRPFLLWGHCSGGLISYELARVIEEKLRIIPCGLVASACATPEIANSILPVCFHKLSDEEFLEAIFNLMKDSFSTSMDNAQVVKILLPGLRADFALYEQYQYKPSLPLKCPIYVFSGEQDCLVQQQHLGGWQQKTFDQCIYKVFQKQQHYFINSAQEILAEEIKRILI